jgi:hypothetical protein
MDEFEKMLRASAPTIDIENAGAVAREVASAVAQGSQPRRKRVSRKAVVIATIGAVLIPVAAAAAALGFAAETGQYGKPGFTENDTSQYINMCASDINSYVATLEPQTSPLPPGVTWDELATKFVNIFRADCPPQGPGSLTQVSGIKVDLLASSACPWENWVLTAPPSSQAADLTRADGVLATNQVTEHQVDPHGTPSWQQLRDQYAVASRAFLNYDYQDNCLGRNTAANPPTVADPNQ